MVIQSSYVTTSWGGDKNRGKVKGKGKGRGEYYWLASLRWSHCCDMLLEGLCCPALHHQKKGKKIGHGTSHSQNSLGILSLSVRHTIYKGIHIRQSKAYCTYYLHTQKHTHPHRHTSSQRNHCSIMQT